MQLSLQRGRARHPVRAVLRLMRAFLRSRLAGDCAPYLIVLLLLFSWQKAAAQLAPADDFFHGGAQLYISNNIPQAKEVVGQGRKLYPDDDKLKKLEELLNQQSQQQSQQNQQQQNQQGQSQQQKPDGQKQQNQQSSPKDPQDQQKQDAQNQPDNKKDDQKPEDKNAEGQPVKPGEMTPEEAKRLLDAQKGNEQVLQLKPPVKPENQNHAVKDW